MFDCSSLLLRYFQLDTLLVFLGPARAVSNESLQSASELLRNRQAGLLSDSARANGNFYGRSLALLSNFDIIAKYEKGLLFISAWNNKEEVANRDMFTIGDEVETECC